MDIFGAIYSLIWYAVAGVILCVIALMLLRFAVNYADLNPFSRPALTLRHLTDPLLYPVQRGLRSYGLDAKFAPLLLILITILVGYFFLEIVGTVLTTGAGITRSLERGALIALIGWLLYGFLGIYALLIIVRVIFSWAVSYANPLMRFLARATDPVLVPFRRLIPPLGMFDISPIIVIFLLQLFQAAIAGTLLR